MSDQTPPEQHEAGGDDKLVPELSMSGDNQIILLGLVVAALVLFGAAIWGFFF